MTHRKPGRPKSEVEMARSTYYIPKALVDKLADFAYWNRTTASSIVTDLLIGFFADRRVRTRPKTKSLADKAKAKGVKL